MKATWPIESRQQKGNKLLLFIISPFLALLYSLKSMNTKSSFVVFMGFAICFGMAFSTKSYESLAGAAGLDAERYRLDFENSAQMTTSEFFSKLNNYFLFTEGERDFYYVSMVYFVSRFTHNYHWLFMAFAIVFAFFQLLSLKKLVENVNWDGSLFCILLALFFTWNQLFNINAMRFYTAAWVAVYSIFQVFLKNKKIYVLLLLITPFFHSSFWLFAGLIVLAYLLKRLEWFWIVLFFISFFSSTFLANVIYQSIDYLPPFLSSWAAGYVNEDRLFEEITFSGSGFWWVPMVFDRLYRIYTNLLVVLFIINRKQIKNSVNWNLYVLAIILLTFVNFAMPIPGLGTRTIVMVYPIIAYIWLSVFGKKKYPWLIYAFPFVWFIQIWTYIGYYNMVLDWLFYFSSPIIMIFKYLILV